MVRVCVYVRIFYSLEYHIPPHTYLCVLCRYYVNESLCIVDDAAYICACVKIKISAVIVPASTNNICVMCVCVSVLWWCVIVVVSGSKIKHCGTSMPCLACSLTCSIYKANDIIKWEEKKEKSCILWWRYAPIEKQNYGIF